MKPVNSVGSYSFAFCCLNKPRNFIRALCNCDFEVPTEHPSILRNFFVFVPFDVVKGKNRAVTGRQLGNGFIEGNPVNNRHRVGVFRAFDYLNRRFAVLSGLLHPHAAFAEVHQHLIDGQPVQPGSKSRLATKASNFSKELNEDLLCEIFSLRDIPGHSQAERINATIMALVKLLEGSHVALSGFLRQPVIGCSRCLGFGCGHVFV